MSCILSTVEELDSQADSVPIPPPIPDPRFAFLLLCAVVAIERFAFYLLFSLFTLFLTGELGMTEEEATWNYGSFLAVMYFTPLLGGGIADRFGRWRSIVLGAALLALGYAVFSGFGVPAQRTAAMLTVAVWLGQFARRWPWPWTWLAAAAVVVAADPWALAQAGFWLSFVAVGLLIATENAADHGRHAASSGRWAAQASRFGREQALITLGLAPLSLLLFGQVSLAGLAANAIAIPWVTFVVMPLALLGVLVPVLWQAAAWGVQAGHGTGRRITDIAPIANDWIPQLQAALAGERNTLERQPIDRKSVV